MAIPFGFILDTKSQSVKTILCVFCGFDNRKQTVSGTILLFEKFGRFHAQERGYDVRGEHVEGARWKSRTDSL
jgi:hypothetical protein